MLGERIARHPTISYPPKGYCIYCGRRDGILTDEHILPFGVVLLRQKLASSGVTVRDTLKKRGLWGTGHERGSAGTVWRLCRGAHRGDRACRSGGAVA